MYRVMYDVHEVVTITESYCHVIELADWSLEHSMVTSVPASTTTLLGVFVSVERTPAMCYTVIIHKMYNIVDPKNAQQ